MKGGRERSAPFSAQARGASSQCPRIRHRGTPPRADRTPRPGGRCSRCEASSGIKSTAPQGVAAVGLRSATASIGPSPIGAARRGPSVTGARSSMTSRSIGRSNDDALPEIGVARVRCGARRGVVAEARRDDGPSSEQNDGRQSERPCAGVPGRGDGASLAWLQSLGEVGPATPKGRRDPVGRRAKLARP